MRGLLWPILARLGVGFRVMHGFSSATCVWDVSQIGNDDRPLVAFYIGDYDPSGMNMSESDLPQRIKQYGGDHIELRRIALTTDQTRTLPSFSVEDKGPKNGRKGDPRYAWFKQNYGVRYRSWHHRSWSEQGSAPGATKPVGEGRSRAHHERCSHHDSCSRTQMEMANMAFRLPIRQDNGSVLRSRAALCVASVLIAAAIVGVSGLWDPASRLLQQYRIGLLVTFLALYAIIMIVSLRPRFEFSLWVIPICAALGYLSGILTYLIYFSVFDFHRLSGSFSHLDPLTAFGVLIVGVFFTFVWVMGGLAGGTYLTLSRLLRLCS
ncbi:MAG TPA: hypothetical protein VGJ20_04125 [Xanthobacteraceae bacterium]